MLLKIGEKTPIEKLKFQISYNYSADFVVGLYVFMLNDFKFLPNSKSFIFYNNLKSEDLSVEIDENNSNLINFDLSKLNDNIKEIILFASVDTNQTFKDVTNAKLNINDEHIFNIKNEFNDEKSIKLLSITKIGNEWFFNPYALAYDDSIEYHVTQYFTGVVTK